jgi:hypothetical protein
MYLWLKIASDIFVGGAHAKRLYSTRSQEKNRCNRRMAYFSEVFALADEYVHFITVASRTGPSVQRMYRSRAGREHTENGDRSSAKPRLDTVGKELSFLIRACRATLEIN